VRDEVGYYAKSGIDVPKIALDDSTFDVEPPDYAW
jgi:hypothetical protein